MSFFLDKRIGSSAKWDTPNNDQYSYRDGTRLDTSCGYHPHISTRFKNFENIDKAVCCKLPELYTRRDECCGCSACLYVCPQNAIEMEFDEEGFRYPVINAVKCVGCSRCVDICVFKMRVDV